MEIIKSEAHRGQFNKRGRLKQTGVHISGMDSGAWHNWEQQGIPNGWTGRSKLARAEYSADMWDIELMCIRRVKDMWRNMGMNKGWQIWWGYGKKLLESQEGNFEGNPSRDWKLAEVFQKGGCAGPQFGTRNNTSNCVLNSLYAR